LTTDNQNKIIVEYPFQNEDNTQPKLNRIPSLDILRGIALILLTFNTSLVFLYKIPDTLNFFGFFSFWLTSLCFPVFAFLVGITIYYRRFNKPRIKVFWYCLILGPLYIFLDLLLISFGYTFNTNFNQFSIQILSTIGIGLIVLSLFLFLNLKFSLIIGLIIFFCNHTLFYLLPERLNLAWISIIMGGTYNDGNISFTFYPFLQILGVMLLGFYFGKVYSPSFSVDKRKKVFNYISIGLFVLFFSLKIINSYGEIIPWSSQKTMDETIASFLKVSSSPPTLIYMCLVFGFVFLLLPRLENKKNKFFIFLNFIGKNAPLYTFIQLFLIHLISMAIFYLRGGYINYPMFKELPLSYRIREEGFNLTIVYLITIILIVIFYFICLKLNNFVLAIKQKLFSLL
jgi:uncharacterized membrane protein